MDVPTGHTQNELLFSYPWVVARELDRVNRTAQQTIPIDSRILKLKQLGEKFLWDGDNDVEDRVAEAISEVLDEEGFDASNVQHAAPVLIENGNAWDWRTEWQAISQGIGYEPSARVEVRWKQLGSLIRLFSSYGLFDHAGVQTGRISSKEEDAFEL